MKKIYKIFLALGIAFSNMAPVFATETKTYTEQISNDLVVEYTISEGPSTRASGTKSGIKTASMKNGSGTVLWTVTVHGTFSYTGSTSLCTASSVTTTCPASTWRITSKSASKSGATAYATATGKHYDNGAVIDTHTQSVFLVCGSDGTLY